MIYGHYYFFPPTEITAFLKRWPKFQFQTFSRVFDETVFVTVRQTDVEFGSVWESLKVSKLTQAISEGLHRYFRILPNLTIDWSQIDLQVKSNLNVNAQMRTEIDLNESEIDPNWVWDRFKRVWNRPKRVWDRFKQNTFLKLNRP